MLWAHGNRPALGRAIVESRDVRMVSFTGGFKTSEAIAASAGLNKLSMDLGGNAPVIIMGDCDLDKAANACVSGAFWAAGQNCIGTQRILLHSSIANTFSQQFVDQTARLIAGDPSQTITDVGPMITETAAICTEMASRVNLPATQFGKGSCDWSRTALSQATQL